MKPSLIFSQRHSPLLHMCYAFLCLNAFLQQRLHSTSQYCLGPQSCYYYYCRTLHSMLCNAVVLIALQPWLRSLTQMVALEALTLGKHRVSNPREGSSSSSVRVSSSGERERTAACVRVCMCSSLFSTASTNTSLELQSCGVNRLKTWRKRNQFQT